MLGSPTTNEVSSKYCRQGNLRSPGNRPTAIDIFAGCGGATLGFRNAGFEIRAAVELDSVACNTYRMNHTTEVNLLECDVRLLTANQILAAANLEFGQTTVLLGCPPCQGFSRHRLKGAGLNDPRNTLVNIFAELVSTMFPPFFVFENVPGIIRNVESPWYSAKKMLMDIGYHIAEGIIDAVDYGVPQHRRRFAAVGCRLPMVNITLPPKTHRSPKENSGLPIWRTVRDVIGELPPLGNAESSPDDSLHSAPAHEDTTVKRFELIPFDGGSRSSLPPEMQLDCHRGYGGHLDVYGRLFWDKPANTLTGGCIQPSKGRFLHPNQNRALSLREAARLQGFPDDYRFKGNKQQIALQIGNSVPPLLALALALSIKEILTGQQPSVTDSVRDDRPLLPDLFGKRAK
jgi:DNA (cytosine-5)-methyltransferase 1